MQQSTALVAQPATSLTTQPPEQSEADTGRLRRLFRAFEENKRREIEEQREARRYYSGRQWSDEEIAILNRRKQPVIWDNRIQRKIDFLVGVEQRMRRDPKAYGRTPQDSKSADVASASLRFVCDQNRWEVIASDAAHDGITSGVGVAWIGIEKDKKGTLDPKIKRGQVDRFFYDPRSTMSDFSDARYMGMHLWLDREELKAEYPNFAGEIDGMFDSAQGVSYIDEDRAQQWADFERNRVRVIEMYERKHTPMGVAWYFCKFTGAVKLDSMWSPYLDEYGVPDCPYVAWSPYIDERGDRYGVVRNMRPMQDEINQRRSKLLHLTNVRQVHLEDGLVEDDDKLREELAKPDGIIKHHGKWNASIGVIDHSLEMRGQADLLAQAQASLENLGPNPGLIGKGGGVADQSGRAILAQRDSGMTELSPVFERLRDWKLRCYRKMWARTRQAWTGERYVRITDDKNAPSYVGLNQYGTDPMSGMAMSQNVLADIDVDIILDEGPDTIVMQEELMQTLSQMGELATGPLGRVMIELSQVANKDQLIQLMDKASAPPPEMQALKQRMAKLEEMLAAAKVDEAIASVESKRADTMAKLANALQPKEQQVHKETGLPMGPPPADPMQGVMAGLNALQMFPLQYGAPTMTDLSMQDGGGQPQQPSPNAMMQDPAIQGGQVMPMPGDMQDMTLDQMPGGLPIDGEVASQMSAGGVQGG